MKEVTTQEIVRQIWDEYFYAQALSALVTHLPDPWMGEALAVTRQIENEYFRINAYAKWHSDRILRSFW